MVDKGKAGKGVTGRADKSKAGKPARGGKSTAGGSDKRLTDKSLTGHVGKSSAGVSNKSFAGDDVSVVTVKELVDKAVDEKDRIDAIVSPRTDDPTARVVAGARVRNCAQCLADVFVAPSTFAYFKGKPMPPIWCVACAMLAAETHGKSPRTGRA